MNDPVILGKFGASFGIQGWIKVYSFTDPPGNIQHYHHWQVQFKGHWQLLDVEKKKMHGDVLIVKIKDIHTPEEVCRYTNCVIGIEHKDLPPLPEGEYYWSQLIGLKVINLSGKTLGIIDHLMDTSGANDVIVIRDQQQQEHLLPYIKSVVKSIDLKESTMRVDWELDPDDHA